MMLGRFAKWVWYWTGPHSPLGPNSAVLFVFAVLTPAFLILTPVVLWTIQPIGWAIAWWWRWWSLA